MILEDGDVILIAHRRLFAEDPPRFFVGLVENYEDGMARVEGYSWLRDPVRGVMVRKPDARTKIVSLASGTLLVYRLPHGLKPEKLEFRSDEGRSLLTDGRDFSMDLTERVQPAR